MQVGTPNGRAAKSPFAINRKSHITGNLQPQRGKENSAGFHNQFFEGNCTLASERPDVEGGTALQRVDSNLENELKTKDDLLTQEMTHSNQLQKQLDQKNKELEDAREEIAALKMDVDVINSLVPRLRELQQLQSFALQENEVLKEKNLNAARTITSIISKSKQGYAISPIDL